MELDEIKISKAIIDTFSKKLMEYLEVDVAVVGAGPAGLACAYYLARKNVKVAVYERKLSVGGGMWGGGIMFNEIVVQDAGKKILDEFGIATKKYDENHHTADSVECVSTLCSMAVKAGARIFNLMSVEDVLIRDKSVAGLVLNWTAVGMAGLHVDPITMRARYVVDSTGHASEVVHIVEKKTGIPLNTGTGKIIGENSMWAEVAETTTPENSKEVCPGLYVSGMSANAVYGGYRMGPVFGGMLLSGKKVAEEILLKLK